MNTNVSSTSRVDVYQIITDRLLAILETGTVPWRKPWRTASSDGPQNLISKRLYRGINYFLLSCAAYSANYWLTYKQAQERGGNVRKGERGMPVIFWKLLDREDKDGQREQVPLLRYYRVFNLEQCEGIKAPPDDAATFHHDPIEAAEAVQLAMLNRPKVIMGGGRACYSPMTDTVHIPELSRYANPEEYYSTFFHELAHATGHESRLNREGVTGNHFFGDAVYSREELVAEMTAAFLCGHTGIENATLQNSAAYLQSWIRTLRGDRKLAIIAAAQAQKAADYILNRKANQDGE